MEVFNFRRESGNVRLLIKSFSIIAFVDIILQAVFVGIGCFEHIISVLDFEVSLNQGFYIFHAIARLKQVSSLEKYPP